SRLCARAVLPPVPPRRSSDLGLKSFSGQFRAAVPAGKEGARFAVAVARRVTEPQVDMGRQVFEQGSVDTPTKAVAMQKMQQGLRSEEHTSELQSRENLVCRLL